MERNNVIEKIKEIISATFKGEVSLENITEETNLIEALGINSIIGIEVLVRVESEFDIEIDDEDLTIELVSTLSTLADYIEKKLNI